MQANKQSEQPSGPLKTRLSLIRNALLVTCYATLLVGQLVGQLVGWSVGLSGSRLIPSNIEEYSFLCPAVCLIFFSFRLSDDNFVYLQLSISASDCLRLSIY